MYFSYHLIFWGGVLSLEIASFALSHFIVLYALIWPLGFLLSGKYCTMPVATPLPAWLSASL
jgi:hypothetical protein